MSVAPLSDVNVNICGRVLVDGEYSVFGDRRLRGYSFGHPRRWCRRLVSLGCLGLVGPC
jgi:hypothetical protein